MNTIITTVMTLLALASPQAGTDQPRTPVNEPAHVEMPEISLTLHSDKGVVVRQDMDPYPGPLGQDMDPYPGPAHQDMDPSPVVEPQDMEQVPGTELQDMQPLPVIEPMPVPEKGVVVR